MGKETTSSLMVITYTSLIFKQKQKKRFQLSILAQPQQTSQVGTVQPQPVLYPVLTLHNILSLPSEVISHQ